MPSTERERDLAIAAAFGATVRHVRTAAGMTQEQVAEAAELHPTFISNVERGYRVPTIVTLVKLAVALEVAPGQLVEGLESTFDG